MIPSLLGYSARIGKRSLLDMSSSISRYFSFLWLNWEYFALIQCSLHLSEVERGWLFVIDILHLQEEWTGTLLSMFLPCELAVLSFEDFFFCNNLPRGFIVLCIVKLCGKHFPFLLDCLGCLVADFLGSFFTRFDLKKKEDTSQINNKKNGALLFTSCLCLNHKLSLYFLDKSVKERRLFSPWNVWGWIDCMGDLKELLKAIYKNRNKFKMKLNATGKN